MQYLLIGTVGVDEVLKDVPLSDKLSAVRRDEKLFATAGQLTLPAVRKVFLLQKLARPSSSSSGKLFYEELNAPDVLVVVGV